jgi:hypothetical protein
MNEDYPEHYLIGAPGHVVGAKPYLENYIHRSIVFPTTCTK